MDHHNDSTDSTGEDIDLAQRDLDEKIEINNLLLQALGEDSASFAIPTEQSSPEEPTPSIETDEDSPQHQHTDTPSELEDDAIAKPFTRPNKPHIAINYDILGALYLATSRPFETHLCTISINSGESAETVRFHHVHIDFLGKFIMPVSLTAHIAETNCLQCLAFCFRISNHHMTRDQKQKRLMELRQTRIEYGGLLNQIKHNAKRHIEYETNQEHTKKRRILELTEHNTARHMGLDRDTTAKETRKDAHEVERLMELQEHKRRMEYTPQGISNEYKAAFKRWDRGMRKTLPGYRDDRERREWYLTMREMPNGQSLTGDHGVRDEGIILQDPSGRSRDVILQDPSEHIELSDEHRKFQVMNAPSSLGWCSSVER